MSCSSCSRNNINVELTCLNCQRTIPYSYKERHGLKYTLSIKKVYCRCGYRNWDLENVERIEV